MRLARSTNGVIIDEGRRRSPGRGAYLCRDASCWERAVQGALARALRMTLREQDRRELAEYGARFAGPGPGEQTDEEHTHQPHGSRSLDERDE